MRTRRSPGAPVCAARARAATMGKLLNKYANGRGLPANAERTARTFDAERRRENGGGALDTIARGGGNAASTSRAGRGGATKTATASGGKKWKSRAGAKPRLMRALRVSAKGHRALTAREVEKLIEPVLQPRRAKYGGQGFAKTSTFVNISCDDFLGEFTALFDEHVDGFNGKSYVKMGKAQEDMLWKQKLREKARREAKGERKLAGERPFEVAPDDEANIKKKKRKMLASPAATTPKNKVDVDLQAQAIAAYRALKAKKAATRRDAAKRKR